MAHPATIVLPSLPTTLLLGLDTIALTPSTKFSGITFLPTGWHFVYAGSTTMSSRTGYWFYASDSISVFEWDTDLEILRPSSSLEWKTKLDSDPEFRKGLLPYHLDTAKDPRVLRQQIPEQADFSLLTSHVTSKLLLKMTNDSTLSFSTSSSSLEDQDEIPGLSKPSENLVFLGINLKRTWREGAVGEERTKAAQDRSWALSQVAEYGWDNILGEMEVCFIMVLLLANWSCLEEWKRIVELVLTSRDAALQQEEFFSEFFELLRAQLERCADVEGGLLDPREESGWLQGLLRGFQRNTNANGAAWKDLKDWLKDEWGWELDDSFVRRGMVELEDGEMVELEVNDMEAEDERGEYAPVVVDL